MPAWSEFVDKDSSSRYIEQFNWIAKNQVSDLESIWYDVFRFYLARRKLEELTALHTLVKGELQVLEKDLENAETEQEKTSKSMMNSDFMRTSKAQIQLMQHVENEIASTITFLAEIPMYTVPDWFVEFLKTVVSTPEAIQITRSDNWQFEVMPGKAARKKK
jgi:hypothetical protein